MFNFLIIPYPKIAKFQMVSGFASSKLERFHVICAMDKMFLLANSGFSKFSVLRIIDLCNATVISSNKEFSRLIFWSEGYFVRFSAEEGYVDLSANSVAVRLECAYAYADLGLHCPHMPEDPFSCDALHIKTERSGKK